MNNITKIVSGTGDSFHTLGIKKMERIKEDDFLKITLEKEIYIEPGELITFSKNIIDKTINIDTIYRKDFIVKKVEEQGKVLYIEFPYRDELILTNVIPPSGENKKRSTLVFSKNYNITQSELDSIRKNGYDIDLEMFKGDRSFSIISGNNSKFNIYNSYLTECKKANITIMDDEINQNEIFYDNLPVKIMNYIGCSCRFTGSDFIYQTLSGEYKLIGDDETVQSKANVLYAKKMFTLPIGCTSKNDLCENRDDKIMRYLVDDIIESSIPEIIDMEKVCFDPYVQTIDGARPVKAIEINPHFRKRILEGWNTDDNLYWTCSDSDGNIEKDKLDKADSVFDMNFTPVDIKFQKNKVKMSFIRFSFYDAPNPLTQQLLYYSTVFVDSNKLCKSYLNSISVNGQAGDLDKEDVTIRFTIRDRNDIDNSSEGFYVYLFPDMITEVSNKTIYMKVEFNHAGVGKTIPFIWNNNATPPKTFINEDEESSNIDINNYFRMLYIPIIIDYSEMEKRYIYKFPTSMYYKDEDTIKLNIFEPKLN